MEQLASAVQGAFSLVARLLLAAVFVTSTYQHCKNFQGTEALMLSEGVLNPKFALFGAIGLQLLGGLSVVLGAWTRIGTAFLLVFLLAATYYFHDFWKLVDPNQQQLQSIQFIAFMKNMAIAGGLMSLMAFGGGPWSIDGWIASKREEAESGAGAKPRVTAKPAERG